LSKTPFTEARSPRRSEAEARFASGPRLTAPDQATSEALRQLQVRQIELEIQNEELRRAFQALEVAHDRYLSLYEFAPVGYVTVKADGTISEVNRAGEPLLGVDRALLRGNHFSAFIDPEDVETWHAAFRLALKARERQAAAVRLRRPNGGSSFTWVELVPVESGPDPVVRVALADLTEYRRLEEELRATQARLAVAARLASVGTLVARVAEKIANPLASILADQGMALAGVAAVRHVLRGDEPLDREAERQHLDAVGEELDEAQAAARRIERIVQDLRLYGRTDAPKQLARLVEIVDQAVRWVPGVIRRAAAIRVENAGAPDVIVSIGQVVQVVVSLLVHAGKATRAGRPCVVIVRIAPGGPGMARLEVIDDGAGIDPRALERIFDPAFTSGEQGEGMELGLSTCHAIVTAQGGTLTVASKVGTGSTFKVELPAASAG
jgi:PAS domain S-box-containing protein